MSFTVLGGWKLELQLISPRYTIGSRIGTLYFPCVFSEKYVLFSLFMNIIVITVRFFFFCRISPLVRFYRRASREKWAGKSNFQEVPREPLSARKNVLNW